MSDTRVTHLRGQEYLPDKFRWLYAITRAPLGQVTDEAGNRAAVIAPAGYARRRRTRFLPLNGRWRDTTDGTSRPMCRRGEV